MNCELCQLVAGDVKTRFYYRDKTCTIVDCLTCHIPMVVLNHHGPASNREKRLMKAVVNYVFGYESIRTEPRRIFDHEHYHIIGAKYRLKSRIK